MNSPRKLRDDNFYSGTSALYYLDLTDTLDCHSRHSTSITLWHFNHDGVDVFHDERKKAVLGTSCARPATSMFLLCCTAVVFHIRRNARCFSRGTPWEGADSLSYIFVVR